MTTIWGGGRVWVLSPRPSVVPCISLHIYFDTLTCHFTLSSRLEIGCLQIMTLTTFQSLISRLPTCIKSPTRTTEKTWRWDGNISKFDIQFIHNQYARMSVKFQTNASVDVSINFSYEWNFLVRINLSFVVVFASLVANWDSLLVSDWWLDCSRKSSYGRNLWESTTERVRRKNVRFENGRLTHLE